MLTIDLPQDWKRESTHIHVKIKAASFTTRISIKPAKNNFYPITINGIFDTKEKVPDKNDLKIREYIIRLEPTNKKFPTMKRKYKPLDIPSDIYKVLIYIDKVEKGIK